MSQSFVHLHCHTGFSLLESSFRWKSLIDQAIDYNMSAVAVTNNGNLFGTVDFYLEAKKKNLNPIIGCDMYLTPDIDVKERAQQRIILLCKNKKGYRNLVKLVTKSHLQGFYYKPRIDMKSLAELSEDLVAISPGMRGPVAFPLQSNRDEEAKQAALQLREIYGDDFYLGIQKTGLPFEDLIIDGSVALRDSLGIPIVALNDVYYHREEDAFLRDVLSCIQTGRLLEDPARLQVENKSCYYKSPEEMIALFTTLPDAIENTLKIADLCQLDMESEQVKLPHFACPDNLTSEAYLEKLVLDGISEKYGEKTPEIAERMRFELDIINKMQYANYFLIIYDFLHFCVESEIPVGPGRGSAAGSIVAYALNITKIDPLAYNLLFERFLNPERISMPDIDLDFCIRRRGEVIQYINDKYGTDHVSQIITFGTMAARGVVRDVGRVLNIPLTDVDYLAKLIPNAPGANTSIGEALEEVADLKKAYDSSSQFKQLLDIGMKLEGQPRHTSTHAAGVVISRDPLSEVVPIAQNDGQRVTQFSMIELEKVGLLKMDILGLRNLTVMLDALNLIKAESGTVVDLDGLLLDDKKTYDLLCAGNTIGVFQLESKGMRGMIKDLVPRTFEDIVALLALYRPGPLGSGMVNDFISNKSGKTQVKYELDMLEPILKDTYGMILYQEQVMQIASVVGGFSLGQADELRRAMGKKKKSVMDEMRVDFMAGAEKKAVPAKKADAIFNLCYKFAEYGFNKSHSAAYALISYQTAYLKANFPQPYMAALMSSVSGSSEKTSLYITECQAMGLSVLAPSVNHSVVDFACTDKGIRFGMGAIKNVGEGAIESIIENRSEGPYKSLFDLCQRVDLKQVNKRVIESLIKGGACDCWGDRDYLIAIFERIIEQCQVLAKEKQNGQTSMFSQESISEQATAARIDVDNYPLTSENEKLRAEKEMLGLYVSSHPLEAFHDELKKSKFNTMNLEVEDGNKVRIMGIMSESRKVITKTKREMMICKFDDLVGSVSVLLFQGKDFDRLKDLFIDDSIVAIKGRVRLNRDEVSINVEEITPIEEKQKSLFIDIADHMEPDLLKKLRQIMVQFRGNIPLYFKVGDATVLAHRKYWVSKDELCVSQFQNLIGQGRVWIS